MEDPNSPPKDSFIQCADLIEEFFNVKKQTNKQTNKQTKLQISAVLLASL